jgi:hypothetical protein
MSEKPYDPFGDSTQRVIELCRGIEKTLQTIEETETQHTVYRTRRNARMLTLLRAIEIFTGDSICPVCGSPPKWSTDKPPKDKQRQDLHDDKCELSIAIDHFESCLRSPGLW